MKASKVLVSLMLIVSLTLVSCSTSNIKTQQPAVGTTAPAEMSTMETQPPAASNAVTSEPSASTGSEVAITNFAYDAVSLTVKVGTTVTWTNQDSVRHTVTSDDGVFDSGLFGKGETFSYTFTEAGTFNYYCIPHPYMKGTIIVE